MMNTTMSQYARHLLEKAAYINDRDSQARLSVLREFEALPFDVQYQVASAMADIGHGAPVLSAEDGELFETLKKKAAVLKYLEGRRKVIETMEDGDEMTSREAGAIWSAVA